MVADTTVFIPKKNIPESLEVYYSSLNDLFLRHETSLKELLKNIYFDYLKTGIIKNDLSPEKSYINLVISKNGEYWSCFD